MATGRDNQVTKQLGEYLVAAEVCRRGFLATTFTGNVPHFDILASGANGKHQAIQVKAIKGTNWQFDCRTFATIRLDGKKQIIDRPIEPPYPHLICVFVRIRGQGTDEFYVLRWTDLQNIAIDHHGRYLDSHKGVRPKKFDSFHMAIRPEMLKDHRDKWELLGQHLS